MTLRIAAVQGLATVQDAGRPGRMHEGVPPGGALVPALLARANEAAGNAAGDAAIEVIGSIAIVAEREATIATEEGAPIALARGERFALAPSRRSRVRYVAVQGGIDVPSVLGGRGALLVAGPALLPGFAGRALQRGDAIPIGAPRGAPRSLGPVDLDLDAPIRVIVGPDAARFAPSAIDALVASTFVVSPASDRTGTRLRGPALPRLDEDGGVSTPMVAGAIEVPASGEPIVLGPDHPTTGGYPVLATVIRADRGAFAARRIGAAVTFRAVG